MKVAVLRARGSLSAQHRSLPKGTTFMRLFLGIFLGVGLALGLAFLHDSNAPKDGLHQIVNWDVLGTVARDQTAAVRRLWNDTIARRQT